MFNDYLGAPRNIQRYPYAIHCLLDSKNQHHFLSYLYPIMSTFWIFTSIYILQADNYRDTGCFNILCSGFVQVHPSIFLGAPYSNTSIYQGQLFVTDIMISQVIPCPLMWEIILWYMNIFSNKSSIVLFFHWNYY